MNITCKLLLKSFYEDEWIDGFITMVREKDRLEFWPGCFSFTGYKNGINIPWYLRPYMWYHLKRGRNQRATEKYLIKKE